MDTMAYRGPDSSGSWRDGPVGLGHLMLHTTPESMHETLPLKNASGDLVITADARIDNREELFEALGIPHPEHSRMPDSAIILKAYEKWGEDCPSHLLGDFAFAIWDVAQRRLFCARDHYGSKPFFYYRSSRFFIFATAIKALFALPHVPRRMSEVGIVNFLVPFLSVGENTFYERVFRLPPANAMVVTPVGVDIRQYWFLEQVPNLYLRSDQEYLEAFQEIFFKAVRSRLRSVRPVGILLSGGLDSGSVACVAARQLKKRGVSLHAFSSIPLKDFNSPVPGDWIADETPYIEEIRRQEENMVITYDRAEDRTPLTDLERDYWLLDRPILNAVNRHWIVSLLEEAQSRDVGVLLTGQEGNNTISWHGRGYFGTLARHGHWWTLVKELRRWSEVHKKKSWNTLKGQILAPLVPDRIWLAYRRWKCTSDPSISQSPINPGFARQMGAYERFCHSGINPSRRLFFDSREQRYSLINPGSTQVGDTWDGLGSGFRMEVRDPTADKRFLEFCLAVPDHQDIRNGLDRSLVRRAMDGILPPKVQWRTQRGLQGADYIQRLSKTWDDLVVEVERLEHMETLSAYLNLPKIRRVMETLREQPTTEQYIAGNNILLRGLIFAHFFLWFEKTEQ